MALDMPGVWRAPAPLAIGFRGAGILNAGRLSRGSAGRNMGIIIKFIRWVFEKFAAAALIVALGLAACALWLFLRDNVDFDQWRQDVVRSINGERANTKAALDDVHKRMDLKSAEIRAEQDRAALAD